MIGAVIVDYYGVLAVSQRGGWSLNAELINLLRNYKKKLKLALLSNTYAKTVAELNPQLDASLFDAVLLGGATGLWKPDPKVYELAAHQLGLPPSEILFVDDNTRHVEAAKSAGLQTHLYQTAQMLSQALASAAQ